MQNLLESVYRISLFKNDCGLACAHPDLESLEISIFFFWGISDSIDNNLGRVKTVK